jgi:hypothetical protein
LFEKRQKKREGGERGERERDAESYNLTSVANITKPFLSLSSLLWYNKLECFFLAKAEASSSTVH